ncbi:MAG: hypothetical protein ACRCU2_18290 [Planktothrix sp.]
MLAETQAAALPNSGLISGESFCDVQIIQRSVKLLKLIYRSPSLKECSVLMDLNYGQSH